MRLPRLIPALAALALLATLGTPAKAQVLDPGFEGGVDVKITLTDLAGQPITRPVAGQPFRVDLRLTDPASGSPVRDERLSGWIRPVEASNSQCREAARAYRASQGVLPRGSTDLARSLYGVRHQDGTFSIVDWEHSLASANIMAIVQTPDAAGPAAALADSFSFLQPTVEGGLLRIPAAIGSQPDALPVLAGEGPVLVSPNGWTARGAAMQPPSGRMTVPLPDAVTALVPAFANPAEGRHDGALALTRGGQAVLAPADGPALPPVQGPVGATAAAHAVQADAILFVDGGSEMTIVYGGGHSIAAPLAVPASRISVSPEGEFAIAWSPDSSGFSIIDIATAAVVQAGQMNRAPADQPLREVGFAEGIAVLLQQSLDFAMVVDLAQVRRGDPVAIRPVRIGPPVRDLPDDAGPFLIETRRGHGSGTVLVLHPDLSTAFPISRESSGGNSTAPMNGFRIAGGRPLSLAELSGGLIEQAPGQYRAATVLSRGGPFELVVAADPGRFSACATFEVEGEIPDQLALQLLASATREADDAVRVEVQLIDQAGVPQVWPGDLPVLLQSLDGGWRDRALAAPSGPASHGLRLADMPTGLVSISFDMTLPQGISIAPSTIEVTR